MSVVGLNSSIASNRFKIVYLVLLMPLLVFICLYGFFYFSEPDILLRTLENSLDKSLEVMIWALPLMLLWLVVGVMNQKRIIFGFTGAKELARKDNPEIYNLVENLCISRGLPVPKIGIMNDAHMNAFATGWGKKDSWVVFSKGLLEKLTKEEVEAVAGHELTHIMNDDVKTMVIVNVFIGIIGTVGYILMRSSGASRSKKGGPLILLGLALYLMSLIILPLINLAISRKKEFMADAGSVQLIKDNRPMISALKKISGASYIPAVQNKNTGIASMFISDPKTKSSFWKSIKGLFATHPPIEQRIEMLKKY